MLFNMFQIGHILLIALDMLIDGISQFLITLKKFEQKFVINNNVIVCNFKRTFLSPILQNRL